MFAGAVRETVYSRPDVIARVKAEFVPVALKAALMNNPPAGVEGAFLAEVNRTKAAPQGMVAANRAGKVLVWALSFSSSDDIPRFLDYVQERALLYPDDAVPVVTKRFMRFPKEPLPDVADAGTALPTARLHGEGEWCPATPPKARGTLVARVVGRRIAADGALAGECTRQENYIEDVFDVPAELQRQVVAALSPDAPAPLPDAFARELATYCYLGMLDVRPVAPPVPQHRSQVHALALTAEPAGPGRWRVRGVSDVESTHPGRDDGARFAHRVTLAWEGWLSVADDRVTALTLLADGRERLVWGNARMFRDAAGGDPATHLMAGRPFELDDRVRYGVPGAPVPDAEAWAGDGPAPGATPGADVGARLGARLQALAAEIQRLAREGRAAEAEALLDRWLREIRGGAPPANAGDVARDGDAMERIQAKVTRLQKGIARWQAAGRSPAAIAEAMQRFPELLQAGRLADAEALLDRALADMERGGGGTSR